MEDATDTNGHVDPGISIRFGPVKSEDTEMDDAGPDALAGKRKSRAGVDQKKSYAEPESSEEEDQPLVRHALPLRMPSLRSPILCNTLAVAFGYNG